ASSAPRAGRATSRSRCGGDPREARAAHVGHSWRENFMTTPRPAPPWQVTEWLNTTEPLRLEKLRGRVIVLHAFQMLCPGCVSRSLPQAQRVVQVFAGAPLVVVGLHTVFEHHDAMKVESLRAFLHEYRIRFPVGVDAPGDDGDPIPKTMR